MRKLLNLSIFLLAAIFGSAYGQEIVPSKTNRMIHPIDSSFGLIDSVVIEYFDGVNVVLHSVTFNRDSISLNATSPFIPARIVKDADTIKMLIN